jgi:signal peptidase I
MNQEDREDQETQVVEVPQAVEARENIEETEGADVTQETQGKTAGGNWKQKQIVLRFIMKVCGVLLALWAIFTFVFGIRQISGESMYPRLRDGDLILYYRLVQNYQIGDVVTYDLYGTPRQARIVAQAGDVVEVNDDGQLIVNGNIQQEEIFYQTLPYEEGITYPYTVEDNSYFVLCDCRTGSYMDSRIIGAVSQKDLDGKVISFLRRRGI